MAGVRFGLMEEREDLPFQRKFLVGYYIHLSLKKNCIDILYNSQLLNNKDIFTGIHASNMD